MNLAKIKIEDDFVFFNNTKTIFHEILHIISFSKFSIINFSDKVKDYEMKHLSGLLR